MEGEVYHLVDREVILERVKSLPYGSPERMFLLVLLDNTLRIHKPNHNYNIDVVIESCEQGRDGDWDCSTSEGKEGFDDMITLLKKCKI